LEGFEQGRKALTDPSALLSLLLSRALLVLQALGKISKTDMKLRLAQLVLARKAKAMNAKARQGLCLLADSFRFCALLVSECLFAGHQAATVAAAEAQPPPDELELEPEPEPAAGARGGEDEGPCLLILSMVAMESTPGRLFGADPMWWVRFRPNPE